MVALVLSLALAALSIQTDHRASGQSLPVVRLVSIEPSPAVREGDSIRITVRIAPTIPAGGEQVKGGIRVWDS